MWGAERGSIFVVVPPSPLLFLFLITDVRPTLKNAWAWQVGLCRNARWHLSWNWTWLPHLADVLNPLMGSAKGVSCVSPSNGLHSEAVPTCWTERRKGWSMQAIAVSPGEKEVCRVVLGVWQYEQLPCFMSLLIDKEPRTLHQAWAACWPQHYKMSGLCLSLLPTYAAQQASSACNRSKQINLKTTELCFRIMLAPWGPNKFCIM